MVRDLGLLFVRGVVGLGFASHGAQKAFAWFGGPGPEKAAGFMESLGFKPGPRFALLSAYTELLAGTSLALGFGYPAPTAAMLGVMLVAAETVHLKNGFFAQKGGVELPVLYATAAALLGLCGPGRLSLDNLIGNTTNEDERAVALAIAGGLLGGALVLRQRRAS